MSAAIHVDLATRLRFNVEQAAEYADRHRDTIRRACEAGALHGGQRTKGGRWSIRRECLDAWLDGDQCAHQLADSVPGQRARTG